MPTATLDKTGLDRLRAGLARVAHIDPVPLMESWTKILDEQNRRGVLAGTDGDGYPMAPVTYRPKKGVPAPKLTIEQRLGQKPNIKRGAPRSFGSGTARNFNNLTSAEYRLLDGPPLAPRRQFSRVITDFATDYAELRPGFWVCTFWWDEVLNTKGRPFLRYHFQGAGRLPKRDLRGVRPEAKVKARQTMINWMMDTVRNAG